jgi:hypothetical protein
MKISGLKKATKENEAKIERDCYINVREDLKNKTVNDLAHDIMWIMGKETPENAFFDRNACELFLLKMAKFPNYLITQDYSLKSKEV